MNPIRISRFFSAVFLLEHKKADPEMESADSSERRFIGENLYPINWRTDCDCCEANESDWVAN